MAQRGRAHASGRRYRKPPPFAIIFLCCATFLVAAAFPARDCTVAPFNRRSDHAAALSWADGDAPWANADGGVIAPTIPIVAVVAVSPDLNIDALGHLEFLGLGRSSSWDSHQQHRGGCRQDGARAPVHHPRRGDPESLLPGRGAPAQVRVRRPGRPADPGRAALAEPGSNHARDRALDHRRGPSSPSGWPDGRAVPVEAGGPTPARSPT